MAEQHRVTHSAEHLLLLLVRLFEYREVHDRHDGARYPEGYARRQHSVDSVDFELAELRMFVSMHAVLLRGVPAAEDRHERDDRRRQPTSEQHVRDNSLRHVARILERLDYRVVTIDGDAHQVQYRAGAEVYVQRVPDVAHKVAEQPAAGHLHARVERHREHRYQHVRERERDNKVVGDNAQLSMPYHRYHYQEIPEHGCRDNRAENADFGDSRRHVRHVPVHLHRVHLGAVVRVSILLGRGDVQQRRHVERGDLRRIERALRGHSFVRRLPTP